MAIIALPNIRLARITSRTRLSARPVPSAKRAPSSKIRSKCIVKGKRRAQGCGRTHAESLRDRQARLAQDFHLAEPSADDLLRDALGDFRLLTSSVHNDVDRRARVVSNPRDRPDAEAQAQSGAARAFLSGIRILMDLEERGHVPGAKGLTLGHHGGWPATPVPPRAPSTLRTSPSDPCGRRS